MIETKESPSIEVMYAHDMINTLSIRPVRNLVEYLKKHPEGSHLDAIALELDILPYEVLNSVRRLIEFDLIEKPRFGKFSLIKFTPRYREVVDILAEFLYGIK